MNINKSYSEYEKWFDEFSNRYYASEEGMPKDYMKLKMEHTKHVVSEIERIAKSENLDETQVELAKIVGLLHDVGRFPQIKKYKIDNDQLSENHALLGIKELENENVLEYEDEYVQNIIIKSIKYHNIKNIPAEEDNEDVLLFSKLIRDADKIDIYRVVINDIKGMSMDEVQELYPQYSFEVKTSDVIYNPIINGEEADKSNIITFVDHLIMQVSWELTEFNFRESKKILYEKKYIDEFHDTFEWDDRAEEIFNMVKKDLEACNG